MYRGSLIALGRHHRLVLLLDGLNEIPTDQQERKVEQVRKYLQALDKDAPVYVSCRSDDYPALDLGLDTLSLEPLAPTRVRATASATSRTTATTISGFVWCVVPPIH